MAVVLLMGFSSGIPLALTAGTLQAWMASEKVDLTVIGIFSLVGLPYTIKFLWAPLLDRYVPPFLGRRRGWLLITQILLVGSIFAMGSSDPAGSPAMLAVLAVLVTFFSASQDIVADAYRTEVLKPSEYGAGAGIFVLGYRIAMVVSGAAALIMADHMSWKAVYAIMAATLLVGIITSILAPEPAVDAPSPKTLREAVVMPFVEFLRRKGAFEMIAFIIIYKLDVVMTLAMTTPFMLDIGFSKTDIGAVTKGFGLIAAIGGTIVGGSFMIKLGIKKALWVFGVLQGIAGGSYMLLAHFGHNYPMMVGAIAAENFFSGMGNAAFTAFVMSLCDKRFTATQYALLSSLMAVTRVVAGAPTGYIAKTLGWQSYYFICIVVAIPGLLLLTRYNKWTRLVAEHQEAVGAPR